MIYMYALIDCISLKNINLGIEPFIATYSVVCTIHLQRCESPPNVIIPIDMGVHLSLPSHCRRKL